MEYGLTTTVQKRLKIEKTIPTGQETDPRFWWEVNLTKLQNRNVLLIVHSSSRYCIVCANMKPSFWKDICTSLHDVIFEAMLREGFSEQEVETYFKMVGEAKVTKTHGKKAVGGLNHITTELPYLPWEYEENLIQTQLTEIMNDMPTKSALHPEYRCIYSGDYFRNEVRNLIHGEEMKLGFAMVKGGTIRYGVLEKYEGR